MKTFFSSRNAITKMQGVAVAVIIIVAFVVAGAYYATLPAPTPTPTPTKPPGPSYGGTLTIAIGSDAWRLDPAIATDTGSIQVYHVLADCLTKITPVGEVLPCLATSWSVSDDGKTWTFNIRKGVKFHDGTPLNASAVAFTFDRMKALPASFALFKVITGTKVVDEYTVQFMTAQPFSAMLRTLGHKCGTIVSPTAVKKMGDEAFNMHPVTAGPYKFVEWVRGDHITFERFDDYWGGKPYLDKIIFKVMPEASARMMALEAGSVHIANAIPPTDVERLNKTKGITVRVDYDWRNMWVGMCNREPPFDNVKVRQALNYAIDKAAIAKIFMGYVRVSDSPIASKEWGYYSTGKYEYDPAKAEKLLDEAGYKRGPDGTRFKTKLYVPGGRYPNDKLIAETVQSNLKNIGVVVEIELWEWAAFWGAINEPWEKTKIKGMYYAGFGCTTGDADYILRVGYASDNVVPKGLNWSRYNSTEADKYIYQGAYATDPAVRLEAYKKALQIIHNDAAQVWLFEPLQLTGIRDVAKGVVVHTGEYTDLTQAWLSPS